MTWKMRPQARNASRLQDSLGSERDVPGGIVDGGYFLFVFR
jgi:hypothetical protein